MTGMVPIKVIELTSSTIYEADPKSGEWLQTRADKPVSDQFNELADQHNLNPFGTPVITQQQYADVANGQVTITFTLCANVIDRAAQLDLEVQLRRMMNEIGSAVTDRDVVAPAVETAATNTTAVPTSIRAFKIPTKQ